MRKILVAFAMKDEFAPWRRRHRFRLTSVSSRTISATSFGSTEAYVALVGAGAVGAHDFDELTMQIAPCLGIVTGVAAGLKPEWRPGDLLVAQTVSNSTGEETIESGPDLIDAAVRCGAKLASALITLPRIARTTDEKVRLARLGDAADMESLPLMKAWSARGIPSLALRVILDSVEMPMTCDFEAAMDTQGQVRITKILAQLALQPRLLPDFLRLARQSRRVLKTLARFLDRFFELLDQQSSSPTARAKPGV